MLRTATELRDLIDRYAFPYFGEWGAITAGWGRGGAQGLAEALQGVNNLKAKGAFLRMPYWLSLVAELYRQTGRPEAARGTLDAALAGGQARSELWWLPEILRLRAAFDDPGPAADPAPDRRATGPRPRQPGARRAVRSGPGGPRRATAEAGVPDERTISERSRS